VPMCGCDPGHGPAPTKLKMLECKLRGGPCQKSNKPDIPNTEMAGMEDKPLRES